MILHVFPNPIWTSIACYGNIALMVFRSWKQKNTLHSLFLFSSFNRVWAILRSLTSSPFLLICPPPLSPLIGIPAWASMGTQRHQAQWLHLIHSSDFKELFLFLDGEVTYPLPQKPKIRDGQINVYDGQINVYESYSLLFILPICPHLKTLCKVLATGRAVNCGGVLCDE